MKEKIVLDFGAEIKNICRGCGEGVKSKCPQTEEKIKECVLYTSRFDEYRVEQVPETYEELKELVKQKVYDDDRNGVKIGQCVKIEYILIDGKSFMPDGEILDEDNDVFAVNRTPAQMWGIIKNLRGEQNGRKKIFDSKGGRM